MAFIKIDREILSSYCFANPNHLKVWIWLLVKANFKKTFASLKIGKGCITVKVERGQLIFGRFKAEEELGLDGSMIYRILQKFEEQEQITIEANNQYSIITICKYDVYQNNLPDNEQPMNNQRTTNEQPTQQTRTANELDMNTSKEGKEGKEGKENIDYAFNSEVFKKCFNDWIVFRKEKKKTLTPSTIAKQKVFLQKYTESVAIQIIEKSIINGWIGLFEPKGLDSGNSFGQKNGRQKTTYEIEMEQKREEALKKSQAFG